MNSGTGHNDDILLAMSEEYDESEPLVLLIGTIDSEGIRSTLKATGRQYKIKRLDSSPSNWDSIISLFESYKIQCAVVKLTGYVYEHFASPRYEDVRDALLKQLAQVPHAIFVHEEVISGNSENRTLEDDEFEKEVEDHYGDYLRSTLHQPQDDVRNAVNDLLMGYGLNVLPYTRNAELTVMASSFITGAEEGLLFRIYIPAGRLWADETDRLIQLFRDYLTRVARLSVRFDQHRTTQGIVYEFFHAANKGEATVNDESLAIQFREFSQLLDLSVSDPAQAEALLRSKHVEPREVIPILTRYAKEAKRLQVDLKHEREQKVLAIQQRLESELVDALPTDVDWGTISALVNSAVPPLSGVSSALSSDQRPLQLTAATGSSVTVNLKPQIVQAVNSVVAQEIEGDIHLTELDQKILQLIREHAADREPELTSAVHELADASAPKSDRLLAKQRLKAFLYQVGAKASEVGVGLLQAYLEKRFGLS